MYRSPFTEKSTETTAFMVKGDTWNCGHHTGEDYICSYTDLVSPCDGTVLTNKYNLVGYGYYVVLKTNDGNVILIGHMKYKSNLKVGAKISKGDFVGTMGNTGKSYGAHLHIEIQKGSTWSYNKNLLKPSSYIDFTQTTNVQPVSVPKPVIKGDYEMKAYKNGSTKEYVYETTDKCKKQSRLSAIGSIGPNESCQCYGKIDDCYLIVYTVGKTKKVGFVKYSGGIK